MNGIVIQFDARTNLEIGIGFAEAFDLIEVNARMITIVVGEGEIAQANFARLISPGLEQFLGIRLKPMTLRMEMIIREKAHSRDAGSRIVNRES